MRKRSTAALLLVAATVLPACANAQAASSALSSPSEAPAGSVAIPLYGKDTPGRPADEIQMRMGGTETVLRNITYPTLTPVLPDPAKANGSAVIVAPGGGFVMLAMQNEGWRVAHALADRGIAAFVLKYRLEPTPAAERDFFAALGKRFAGAAKATPSTPQISWAPATEDALAALKLVRSRSAEWHVDKQRVGMIGFSAGAIATLQAVLQAGGDKDPATQAPDLVGYIYGPMSSISVPAAAPPMFAALAMDDPLFGKGDWSLASAWHAARRPVELHVYEAGGHGFGLGRPGSTSMLMMDQFIAWMDARGFLTRKDKK